MRSLAPAALALLLAACASLPRPPGERAYTGRFSLTVTHASDRREAVSGSFALAVDGDQVRLDLGSPMGSTLARVESGPDGARLLVPADGGLRVTRGADAEQLSEQTLGWRLPVSGLADWIEGRPAAGLAFRRTRAENGAELIEQAGWTVRVERRDGNGPVRRLQMDRAAGSDGAPAVALRIVVDAPSL